MQNAEYWIFNSAAVYSMEGERGIPKHNILYDNIIIVPSEKMAKSVFGMRPVGLFEHRITSKFTDNMEESVSALKTFLQIIRYTYKENASAALLVIAAQVMALKRPALAKAGILLYAIIVVVGKGGEGKSVLLNAAQAVAGGPDKAIQGVLLNSAVHADVPLNLVFILKGITMLQEQLPKP